MRAKTGNVYEVSLLLRDEEGLYGYHLERLITVLNDLGKVKLLKRKQSAFPDNECCRVSLVVKFLVEIKNLDDFLLAFNGLKYVRIAKSNSFVEKALDIVVLSIKDESKGRIDLDLEKYEKLGYQARLLLEKKLTPLTLERLFNIESEMINVILKYDELTIAVFD
ncbi:MAG: hypothetical protein ACP6IS_08585 [Candidatus Asgardarchaeia archaeon]